MNIDSIISKIEKRYGISKREDCQTDLSYIKDLVDIGLDGIEVYYPYPRWRKYIKFSNPNTLEAIADKYNLIKTGGTDCHEKTL